MKRIADESNLLFIPTVGPGYDERKKSKKIHSNRNRSRSNGKYFSVAWRSAISIKPKFIAIASYNDWMMGTQIEEAIPFSGYKDYSPGEPTKYLSLTQHWIQQYEQSN